MEGTQINTNFITEKQKSHKVLNYFIFRKLVNDGRCIPGTVLWRGGAGIVEKSNNLFCIPLESRYTCLVSSPPIPVKPFRYIHHPHPRQPSHQKSSLFFLPSGWWKKINTLTKLNQKKEKYWPSLKIFFSMPCILLNPGPAWWWWWWWWWSPFV